MENERNKTVDTEITNTGETDNIQESYPNVVKTLHEIIDMFNEKIRTDEHKNQMFDNMHEELVKYRNGQIERSLDSVYLDLIQLAETYRNVFEYFSKIEILNPDNVDDIMSNLENISYDVEDILYRMGVETYSVEGNQVDPKKQKIVRTIPAETAEQENTVAMRLGKGYEKDGRIVRQEKIAIYKAITQKGEK